MVARYSGPENVNEPAFQNMSISYHEAAEEYLDMVLRDANINPTLITKQYDVLTAISLGYAKERFLDSKAAGNDGISEQLERTRRDRENLERRFLIGIIARVKADIGSDTSDSAITIQSGRMRKA